MLAALLLIGLLPAGVVLASAESALTTSNEAIAVLKEWEGFLQYPTWDNGQYSIGYGSSCDPDDYPNGISRAEAEVLLREHLISFEAEVNEFANKNGLTFTQNQFDGLLLFTYNVGGSWMNSGSSIRDSVVRGDTGNEFIFWLTRWCVSGGSVSVGHIKRRLAEADIYLNGYYAKNAPDCFTYVQFNGNGGTYNYNVQGYDATDPVAVKAEAVYDGYSFLGWYTSKEGGRWISTLDNTTKGITLYAHWQPVDGGLDTEGNVIGTAASYERIASADLTVYDAPNVEANMVDTVSTGDSLFISADYVDSDGAKWGKLEDGGWVALGNTSAVVTAAPAPDRSDSITLGSGSTDVEEEAFCITVTVTSNSVNFRNGPGATYTKLGTLSYGQELIITEVRNVDGMLWGKFSYGWISLMYTNYDQVVQESGDGNEVIAIGTVISSGALRIRSGAGTGYATVGTLSSGSKVNIYEIVTAGNALWGRISNGWICLTYVNYSMVNAEEDKEADTDTETGNDPVGTPVNICGWVTATSLNVREGAGAQYDVVTRLPRDTYVTITVLIQSGSSSWGKTEQGWICMDYILIDTDNSDYGGSTETPDDGQDSTDDDNTGTGGSSSVTTGMVTASRLCVRRGPGTSYDIVSTLANGTVVTILEQTLVNGTVWGRIDGGWICMSYVKITSGSTSVVHTGMVTASTLCIRSAAGTANAIVGTYTRGTVVQILEVTKVNGTLWGRTDKGWICMDYVQTTVVPDSDVTVETPEAGGNTGEDTDKDNDTEKEPDVSVDPDDSQDSDTEADSGVTRGVVTASNLCVRSGPGTNYAIVSTIPKGTELVILQQTLVNGTVWGQIESGWVCMTYVEITSGGSAAVCTGMVTATSLSIRSAAGTGNAVVGTYYRGDVVQILELVTVNNTVWGRTEKGWICMDYVQVGVNVPSQPEETPDTPEDTETPTDPETPEDTETPTDPETPVDPETPDDSEDTVAIPSFPFTCEAYVAALNSALTGMDPVVVECDSQEADVKCYELVSAADGASYGVMIYLEFDCDSGLVTAITLASSITDEIACENLGYMSAIAMMLVDDTITDADLEAMMSGDPYTDEEGNAYYIMERASGTYIYLASAEVFCFCMYPPIV